MATNRAFNSDSENDRPGTKNTSSDTQNGNGHPSNENTFYNVDLERDSSIDKVSIYGDRVSAS